jgi:hypothetical protein
VVGLPYDGWFYAVWRLISENGRIAFCDFSVDGFVGVAVNPCFFFAWYVGVCEDGIHRTFWDTCATVDAFIRVYDKVGVGFSEGFDGANMDAFLVLVVNAG